MPATRAVLDAALASDADLARALGAVVPATWPPEFHDADALVATREALGDSDATAPWRTHYWVRRADRALLGFGGYYGPPGDDGEVGIGYTVVEEAWGQGLAPEAMAALVDRAFDDPRTQVVFATTFADRPASIRVLDKLGFARVVDPEPGLLRYERRRGAG